ncbi:MAG: hypothetical protein OHK0017_07900 [Patescibacteria group bacterium]
MSQILVTPNLDATPGYKLDGVADEVQINGAIIEANQTGKEVIIDSPYIQLSNTGRINPKNNVTVRFKRDSYIDVNADIGLFCWSELHNFKMYGFPIFDTKYKADTTGIDLRDGIVDCHIEAQIINSAKWGFVLGVIDGVNTGVINERNHIDLITDGHTGLGEAVLLFNEKNNYVKAQIKNKFGGGHAVGLYQKNQGSEYIFKAEDLSSTLLYYSEDLADCTIDIDATNVVGIMAGANRSNNIYANPQKPNGFVVKNLKATASSTIGNGVSCASIGGIDNFELQKGEIKGYPIGIIIGGGGTGTPSTSQFFDISNLKIENTKASAESHSPILIQAIGGNYYGNIQNVSVVDTQPSPTTRSSVAISGNFARNHLRFTDCNLPGFQSRNSVFFADGALPANLGGDFVFYKPRNFTPGALNPANYQL